MTVQETALTYRKATPADASPVRALVFSAYRGESSRTGWTTEADLFVGDERIDEEGVLAKINEPEGAILLAFDSDGTLAACCELLKRSDELTYFGLFAVDPNRQAGGIGRNVLAEAEAYAKREWGTRKMEMSVIWTREELIAWYERRGYSKMEETKPFPYGHMAKGRAVRDDLYFSILTKEM